MMRQINVSTNMTKLDRGYLTFSYDLNRGCDYYHFGFTTLDPYDDENVKRYDDMLHRTLRQIFRERCPSNVQRKKFLCDPEHTDQSSVIKLLLELEPDLSEIFPAGNKLSLLWIAVLRCYRYSAELLVRSGADVNERCGVKLAPFLSETITILHLVLQMYPSSWNEQFIRLVLDHGADLQARDSHGQTVLHYAVKNGQVKATALLLGAGADVNVADIDGKTPLLEAARSSESDELMPQLLEHGADATVRDSDGRNALHHLAMAFVERVDLARALIAKGVSLDDREHRHNQYQPIHYATLKGKNKLVKLFLDHGADVDARSKGDIFPLYLATEHNKPSVLLTLLRYGANVGLHTNLGRTALHRACSSLHDSYSKETFKILLSVGADVFFEDHTGRMPFDFIREKCTHNPMIRLMLKTLALRNACLRRSMEYKDKQIISPYPKLWKYYESCVYQIRKLRSTFFIGNCAFSKLLTKCQCHMMAQMRDFDNEGRLKPYDLEPTVIRQRNLRETMCEKALSRLVSLIGRAIRSVNFFSAISPERSPSIVQSAYFQSRYRRYVVDVYTRYSEDLLEAFERALNYYQSVPEQENLINEAVYNVLPWMVVRRVALYIVECEDCEMKKIVHKSLGFSDDLN